MTASTMLKLRRADSLQSRTPRSATQLLVESPREDDVERAVWFEADRLPEESAPAEDENEATEVVKWWKQKRSSLCASLSVKNVMHDVTVLGDFFFERYVHFWQLLRNVHFSNLLPAVLITRVFFRGVYLLIVGVERRDYHEFEWSIRVRIRRSFQVENKDSFFYDFYVDILIEIVFIALISKANNATFNRALSVRLRNWQWLFLGVISLYVCVLRDIRLTQFYLHPATLNEKSKNIIHTIGTLILALCDAILVWTFAYIVLLHIVLYVHDRETYRHLRADVDGGSPNSPRHHNFELINAEIKHVEVVDNSCKACFPTAVKSRSRDDAGAARLERRLASREERARKRKERRERFRQRAQLAARNFRTVLRQRMFAPEYVFREADQRALLAALLHPPGACEGRFQAHDLIECAGPVTPAFLRTTTSVRPAISATEQTHCKDDQGTRWRRVPGVAVFEAWRSSRRAKNPKAGNSATHNPSVIRNAQKSARTVTNSLFSGLWSTGQIDTSTTAQRRATRLDRLHLREDVDWAWQERIRHRTYEMNARLLMCFVMGWLLAVAATAGLAYGSFALQNYIGRRLDWIEDTVDDVEELLSSYRDIGNLTSAASEEIIDELSSQLQDEFGSYSDVVEDAVADILEEALDEAFEEANLTVTDAINETVSSALDNVLNATTETLEDAEVSMARRAAELIVEYVDQYYEYVEDYLDVLNDWLDLAKRANRNVFMAGVLASAVAFALMNYSLLMLLARYREVTHRFRETGMIDDMDLITDEAQEPVYGSSEWFWIIMTAPSAPYAVALVGNAVSNMLIISIMVMLVLFVCVGIGLFPGAIAYTSGVIVTQVGSWIYIYPIVYCIDWFYLNAFIADRTYVIHRSCFDLWDFVIGIWKLVSGLFGGLLRFVFIYILATANTIRIDWTIFAGRIGWLDIGYNSFASAVMLTERHGSPSLSGASRLLLSAAPKSYSGRICAEHVLAFDIVAPSPALDAAESARDLPNIFERVLMDDPEARSIARRARAGLAWRTLHLVWILAANPSLLTWNVKKWRENPISDAIWRRARDHIKRRRERDRRNRRATAMLELADRELHHPSDSTNGSSHQKPTQSAVAVSLSTLLGYRASIDSSSHAHSPKVAHAFAKNKKRGASVIDRIDRLEAVIDERLPDDVATAALHAADDATPASARRDSTGGDNRPRRPSAQEAKEEKEAIVSQPDEVADILTRFQLGYLRTTFRLLDKDQDDLVTVDDLKFHYKSQGNVLPDEEAHAIIDAVSVMRKGYYYVAESDNTQGELMEVEREGFDLPELLAYMSWRLATEERTAVIFGTPSGLSLSDQTRKAVLDTLFVRFKGLDERVVNVADHLAAPLSWPQVRELIRRTRIDRGPFGIRKAEGRLLFDLLALGKPGGDFLLAVENQISKECGPFFAENQVSMADRTHIDYETFAAFFDASLYDSDDRINDKDLKDDDLSSAAGTENGDDSAPLAAAQDAPADQNDEPCLAVPVPPSVNDENGQEENK